MVTVTDRAADALQTLLENSQAEPGQGVKLVPNPDASIGLVIDAASDGDEVVQRGDDPLLIVDKGITGQLAGAVIDCDQDTVDGRTQTRFTLQRPSG